MRSTRQYLDAWVSDGRLTRRQHDTLDALASRRRVSLFAELNGLLYLGVLAFAGGLAWRARTYSDQWGDLALLLPATALVVGCFAWMFARTPAFSRERVASPSLAFDYVLYLGCLVLGVELGYAQYRFPALQAQWDLLLLASSVVYFAAAYRFDNRFVLSLGIATLGGWFGVRVSRLEWIDGTTTRLLALTYGLVVAAIGGATWQAGFKRHFLEGYLRVAALVVLSTLTWNVLEHDDVTPWLPAALVASAICVAGGARTRHFSFVVYGAFAGYVCVSRVILPHSPGVEVSFFYVVVSSVAMVAGLVVLSRRMGRQP
ncbi:MAG: DUF2157 domain-containing protein [Vicinamibacterales bacterium]